MLLKFLFGCFPLLFAFFLLNFSSLLPLRTVSAQGCNPNTVGTNQLLGCLYDGTTFNQLGENAPSGPVVTNTAGQAALTALYQDWQTSAASPTTGADTFSARWKGNFIFQPGTYTFYAYSDDGTRIFRGNNTTNILTNNQTGINSWSDHGANLRLESPPVTYTSTTTDLITVEYYENNASAMASFGWNYTPPSSYAQTPLPIYRFLNAAGVDHFYSSSSNPPQNYVSEGVAFYAYAPPCLNGTMPVYRSYNASIVDHFYSLDPNEGLSSGYVSEGIEFCAYNATGTGRIPVFRLWQLSGGDHFYTTSAQERDSAINNDGYVLEGGSGYFFALPTPPSPTPTQIPTSTPTPTPLVGDVDRNGCVGIIDLSIWLFAYRTGVVQQGTYPNIDNNGIIDLLDFNQWSHTMATMPNVLCQS